MNQREEVNKRLVALETAITKIEKFLPTVELWLTVLAEQFKLNRNFILSLDKKPEVKNEKTADAPIPTEPSNA